MRSHPVKARYELRPVEGGPQVELAEAAGARLATFDKGLAATAKFRRVAVTLLRPTDGKAAVHT